ncbi:peptidase M48, Ste24p [Sulfitobacter sp. SK012]|nr:peptidase M48, Ste24p [Sulfitobacter sp. SK012]
MFAAAQQRAPRQMLSPGAAEQRFRRVASRISAVGTQYCKTLTAERQNFNCSVDIAVDREMRERNAYFTYQGKKPIIRISQPMLQDSANDDEVAFILSHEFGHLIGRHIEKQQQQALAGAIILGAMTAAANEYSASNGGYYDSNAVSQSMETGAALGSRAYSQSYELESDTLGTRIAAAAGYDPVKGAMFFARPEAAKTTAGNLSFWGTHPPDEKRLATVIATAEEVNARIGLRKAAKTGHLKAVD